ncbi:MAG: hypothetical protein WC449_05475 [Candidatus Paceibacterota bacterium]
MIRSAIRTFARALLAEPTAATYTDAEINIWINEGMKEVCSRTRCYTIYAYLTLVNATQSYTPLVTAAPVTNMIGTLSVVDYAGLAVPELDFQKIGTLPIIPGTPSYWKQSNKTIWISPAPNAVFVVANPTWYVWLYGFPADMTDDANTPDIPYNYHWLLALYAAFIGKLKTNDAQRAATFYKYFSDGCEKGGFEWAGDIPGQSQPDSTMEKR